MKSEATKTLQEGREESRAGEHSGDLATRICATQIYVINETLHLEVMEVGVVVSPVWPS